LGALGNRLKRRNNFFEEDRIAKQARGKRETPVAVHSYFHLVRKNGAHLGGGWTQADVAKFFTDVELPAPDITDVSLVTQAQSHS
jgi:hypothetical protein